MAIFKKIINQLEDKKVKYEIIPHKKVYTAFDAAATLKVKLEQVIKVLLVKAEKEFYLVLLSANKNLDFRKLGKFLKVDSKKIQIVKEKVMTEKFKVKPGAISAFGSIHKLPVVVEKSLIKIKEGIFPSGSFTESLRMKVSNYLKLEQPIVGIFGMVKKMKKPRKKS
ncbi:YbaK/EbsC family protein [Patescibacteria group bacterium]|nr:YbaK/EbsC family protein [Patescibacteria group bacterium]